VLRIGGSEPCGLRPVSIATAALSSTSISGGNVPLVAERRHWSAEAASTPRTVARRMLELRLHRLVETRGQKLHVQGARARNELMRHLRHDLMAEFDQLRGYASHKGQERQGTG
jgi:hypothetical protein